VRALKLVSWGQERRCRLCSPVSAVRGLMLLRWLKDWRLRKLRRVKGASAASDVACLHPGLSAFVGT
jgi:hypothetical protein